MTFVIRSAQPADTAAVGAVFRRASLSNPGDRENLLAHPEVLDVSDIAIAVAEGRAKVAVADGQVIGFATWLSEACTMEIEDLFVDPGWMGRGVGYALVLDIIEIARGNGLGHLEVTANEHAVAFYEKVGFVTRHKVETRFGPAPRMYLEARP